MVKTFHEVGKSRPLITAPYLVDGSAWYTADLRFPNALHCKVLRSHLPHAKIKNIDISKAEKLPGVMYVATHKDVPKVKFNISHHPGAIPKDEYVLSDRVRYVGDKVAAVAARDRDTAERALELIDIEYEELPSVFDPEKAMKPDAPRIHNNMEKNICTNFVNAWGDVEKGFKEADSIFEDEYYTQAAHPSPIEPHACISYYKSGKLEIWSSTQTPHRSLAKLSDIFGIPQSKIRIYQPYVGGGFGVKCDIILEPITAFLSLKTGAPVILELTREEVLTTTYSRHPSTTKLKIGVKKDGTITARQVKTVIDTGAYASQGPGVMAFMVYSCNSFTSLYKTPNLKIDGYCVYTNKPPAGAFRGYGNPQVAFAAESMLDTIARELGIDPIELRLKNVIQKGDIDPTTKFAIKSYGLQECAEKTARTIGWKEKRGNGGVGIKRRGLGTAWLMHCTGVHPVMDETCSSEVKMYSDGKISVIMSAPDIGQGIMTTTAQIAAEELGVPLEDVDITRADTIQPFDKGTYASGGLYITGESIRRATADVKTKLLNKAALELDARVESLQIENGKIKVKGTSKDVPISEIMKGVESGELIGKSTFVPISNAPNFGVVCAEVDVDVETGEVFPVKIVYAHDVGKAINPAIVKGQVESGIIQGIGFALTEDLIYDDKTGGILNPNFVDYKILTARDLPELVPIIVESQEPTGPYMAKGLGEAPIVAVAPAITNAIYDAVGVRIKKIPVSPEKLYQMISRKNT